MRAVPARPAPAIGAVADHDAFRSFANICLGLQMANGLAQRQAGRERGGYSCMQRWHSAARTCPCSCRHHQGRISELQLGVPLMLRAQPLPHALPTPSQSWMLAEKGIPSPCSQLLCQYLGLSQHPLQAVGTPALAVLSLALTPGAQRRSKLSFPPADSLLPIPPWLGWGELDSEHPWGWEISGKHKGRSMKAWWSRVWHDSAECYGSRQQNHGE